MASVGTRGASVLLAVSLTLWMLASRHAAGAKLSVSPVSRPVPAPEAEKLYLRGRYFWNLRTPESLSKAVDAYTQAIVEDPSYAEPYAGLAEAYELMPQFAHADLGEAFARARSAADRAIQLNPNLVAAHRAKAFVLFYWDWDIAGSDEEFKQALGLDPNSAETHHWYASTLFSRLEGPECLQQIEEARRLSPGSAAIAADAAYFRASFDDLGAGMRALREIEQTQPTLASPAQFLSELDFATGNFPAYIEDLHKYAAITRNGDDAALADAVERGWARSGKEGLLEARALALKTGFGHGTERGFVLGETLLLLGRSQEALPYFKAAIVNHHDIGLAVIRQDPSVRKLLDGPGYRQLFGEVDERLRRGDLASPAVLPVSFRLPF